MACSELVTFRFGFVADYVVVERLLDIESRGGSFTLEDEGHFRVHPPTVLTDDDKTFLRRRRAEALAVVEYMNRPEWRSWKPA
jgi:hypothetical protein